MAAKASRVQLSDADRKLICDLAQSNSNLTQEKLTRLVAERLGKPDLARSTVTGVLKHSDKWLKVSQTSASKTVKHRGPQNEKLELALIEWFGNVRARGGSIVDRLIVEKAKEIATELDIQNFKASDGWLAGFKARHGIKLQRPKGESGSADMEGVDIARTVVGQIVTEQGFQLENIYNMDETGLYYRAKPSKTLAVGKSYATQQPGKRRPLFVHVPCLTPCMPSEGSVQGIKMQKDRITLCVCVNATGTDRLKLVVIHTAKRPRDFGKTWQPSDVVDYFSNTKAWMTMQARLLWLLSTVQCWNDRDSSVDSGV